MLTVKNRFDELIKSTLLTLSLFTLFDITFQGYHHYHIIFISGIVVSFLTYSLYKHFHQQN